MVSAVSVLLDLLTFLLPRATVINEDDYSVSQSIKPIEFI